MKEVVQAAMLYENYRSMSFIHENIKRWLEDGWRVHTFLERNCEVLVIYEKKLGTWN